MGIESQEIATPYVSGENKHSETLKGITSTTAQKKSKAVDSWKDEISDNSEEENKADDSADEYSEEI